MPMRDASLFARDVQIVPLANSRLSFSPSSVASRQGGRDLTLMLLPAAGFSISFRAPNPSTFEHFLAALSGRPVAGFNSNNNAHPSTPPPRVPPRMSSPATGQPFLTLPRKLKLHQRSRSVIPHHSRSRTLPTASSSIDPLMNGLHPYSTGMAPSAPPPDSDGIKGVECCIVCMDGPRNSVAAPCKSV